MSLQTQAWLVITAVLAGFELWYRDLLVLPFALGAASATLMVAFAIAPGWEWAAFVGVASILTVWFQRVVVPRRLAQRDAVEPADEDAEDVSA